ncbi:unnamed protein product [Acanthoscelides obtectus]|uniref:Uncharacterized protein n=1 Tax=Acanthoscelides obtectus TaxID=200917 RepID=A0A9P0LGI9_ACAOB|nr:unnamed protein product [Acanthoscelides obtectus]CAK1663923.1 hypothetical protein AOBTE_LOCUS23931 [Acanthoscelides obtectus]
MANRSAIYEILLKIFNFCYEILLSNEKTRGKIRSFLLKILLTVISQVSSIFGIETNEQPQGGEKEEPVIREPRSPSPRGGGGHGVGGFGGHAFGGVGGHGFGGFGGHGGGRGLGDGSGLGRAFAGLGRGYAAGRGGFVVPPSFLLRRHQEQSF